MKIFNRDNRSGGSRDAKGSGRRDLGRRNFGGGGGRGFGGRDSGRPSMHQVTCSECGKECEVPFRPTGDRPVFCSSCFEKHGNKTPGREGRNDSRRGSFNDKQMYQAVCDKCGKECEVPFRPTSGKPVYCNQCFGKGKDTSGKSPEQFKQQFEVLNAKLDQILKALAPTVSSEATKEIKKPRSSKASIKAVPKKAKTKKK